MGAQGRRFHAVVATQLLWALAGAQTYEYAATVKIPPDRSSASQALADQEQKMRSEGASDEIVERYLARARAAIKEKERGVVASGRLLFYHDGKRRSTQYFVPVSGSLGSESRALPYRESFDGQVTLTKGGSEASVFSGDTASMFRTAAHALFLTGQLPRDALISRKEGGGLEIRFNHGVIGWEVADFAGTLTDPRAGSARIEDADGRIWLAYEFEAKGGLQGALRGSAPYELTVRTFRHPTKLQRTEVLRFTGRTEDGFVPSLGEADRGAPVMDGRLVSDAARTTYEWPGRVPNLDEARSLADRHAADNSHEVNPRSWAFACIVAGAAILAILGWRARAAVRRRGPEATP